MKVKYQKNRNHTKKYSPNPRQPHSKFNEVGDWIQFPTSKNLKGDSSISIWQKIKNIIKKLMRLK